ncbi:MAG: FtsX-like permease family protein [Pyrinomonadaceae bacterium]|nr:FtsX-like permease family protein [Pyrinomonadaceae bacterium]
MTTPWRKVIRDFWKERMRTALVVLAIALGISGFASVMAAYAILTRALDEGYLATNPASATLRTDRIDDDLISAILANPEVSDAEPRRVVNGRIRSGPVEWRNLMIFVVKDFGNIRVSKLNPEAGAWPPALGEILIERDAFRVARARIGDTVTVKIAQGKEQTLRVSGGVHDVGQAQARMENMVYGYITLATLAQLGEEAYLDQLNILVAQNRFDEGHIRTVATDIQKLVEGRGHPVRRLDIPRPGKHPHTDITGVMLLSMSTFGLFVLVLSGIVVVNLITALMASQVRQIGVMKAIGGTRWQIARIYFGQALLLGVAAIIVSLPLGLLGSRILCRYLAAFLNFDINSFAVPVWVYLLVALVGLVTPLLAAAYPVWKGSGISVREALADFGTSRNTFGTSVLDRALAGVGGSVRPLVFALRNSFRQRTRLALTLLTMAAGGLFFISALNVRASMISTLDRLFAGKKYDLSVALGNMYPSEKLARVINNTPGIVRGEGWFTTDGTLPDPTAAATPGNAGSSGLHSGGVAGGGQGSGGSRGTRVNVIALPPETNLLKLEIVEGRDLLPGESDTIVINSALAKKLPQLKVGDPLTLQMGPAETTWRVVGISRESFSPSTAYIPLAFIAERHPGMANNLRLVLNKTDAASINAVKTSLERNLELEDVRALGSLSQADSRFSFDQHMLMIYVFLIVMSGIIGGVGGLGLMTTMSLNVMERRREMGLLRAIGASPGFVWTIVVAEGVLVGLLSWALAALVAWPVSKLVGNFLTRVVFQTGLEFAFETRGLFIWLAVSVLVSAAASFIPAWRASRFTVREALAYE